MSAEGLTGAAQAGLAAATTKRTYDPERHCGAHCRRTDEPCTRFPVAGSKRCRQHGGKSKRGPEHGRYRHGEDRTLIPVDEVKAAVAIAVAELGQPAEKVAEVTMRANLADRRKRRAELEGAGGVDLDVAERLDAGDRGDAAVLLKAAEQQRDDLPEGNTTIQIANISANPVSNVRGPDGAMTQMLNLPDGTALLRCADGAWRPCEPFSLSGVSCYRPVLQLGAS